MLKWRVASAVVGLPLVVAGLWLGGWPLVALVGALAALGGIEWWRLVEGFLGYASSAMARRLFFIGLIVIIAISSLASDTVGDGDTALPPSVPLAWAALTIALGFFAYALLWTLAAVVKKGDLPFAEGAALVAGWLYIGFALAHWPALRRLGDLLPGVRWAPGPILWAVAVVWAGDTAAYFAGRQWGRTPLAPHMSPKKTVEGAVAGLLSSLLAALLLYRWTGKAWPSAALAGLLVGVVGQLGDLWESALKRGAQVKDSGALIPGHGGILDRFDGLLLAVPAAYYLLAWLPI